MIKFPCGKIEILTKKNDWFGKRSRIFRKSFWFYQFVDLIRANVKSIFSQKVIEWLLKLTKMSITLDILISPGQSVFFLNARVCVSVNNIISFHFFLSFHQKSKTCAQLIELDWFVARPQKDELINNKAMKIIAFLS